MVGNQTKLYLNGAYPNVNFPVINTTEISATQVMQFLSLDDNNLDFDCPFGYLNLGDIQGMPAGGFADINALVVHLESLTQHQNIDIESNNAQKHWSFTHFYKIVKDNDTLNQMSRIIRSAFDSLSNENIGKLWKVDSLISIQEWNAAGIVNNSIQNPTIFENYQSLVNDIYIQARLDSLIKLDYGDSTVLENIATMCPDSAGQGVYTARMVLTLFDNTLRMYNTCGDTSDLFVESNDTFGRKANRLESFIAEEIQIYPNPSKDYLQINLLDTVGVYRLEVFNSTGQIVFAENIENGLSLSVRDWSQGLYFFRFYKADLPFSTSKIQVIK